MPPAYRFHTINLIQIMEDRFFEDLRALCESYGVIVEMFQCP